MRIDTVEVRTRLQELAKKHGGTLTPRAVWEDARDNPIGPLHCLFEWDLQAAAEEHWTDRARMIIRSVSLEEDVEESTIEPATPYFVRDPSLGSNAQGYISMTSAKSNVDVARGVVANECAAALGAVRRAERVAGCLGLQADLSKLRKTIERVRTKASCDNHARK